MYEHILVPTDGSELSSRAVTSAIRFAKSIGARITLLYVQPDYPRPIVGEGALIAPENREEFLEETTKQANGILATAQAAARTEGVTAVSYTEVSDVPYQVIIDTAEREKCDLIFMASHGRKGLAGLLIGSETHKVLTHSKMPVLVYREG
jgi:nucleotide-binding universal stress UspA family protein